METNNALMKDLVDPHCVSLIIEQPLIRDSPESAITNFFRFILEANQVYFYDRDITQHEYYLLFLFKKPAENFDRE